MSAVKTALYFGLVVTTLVAMTLSLMIVFQAYRGYRRNESQRMLYLAVGLGCITIAPFALSLGGELLAPLITRGALLRTAILPLVSRLLQITGLGLILYSLYSSRLGGSV